jgi:hypothetical protein
MTIDLNPGSGSVYGAKNPSLARSNFVNALIDRALEAERKARGRRDYLGASRIGEPCARRLCFELSGTAADDGADHAGRTLRIFEAGHILEELSARWLRAAGFDLRTRRRDGEQFGFEIAQGRIRGHIDGVIINGLTLGLPWPILWEHKSANAKSWSQCVKSGLEKWNTVYWGQVHLYMAYMDLEHCLFTVVNKDSLELHHQLIIYQPAVAQALSDKAVAVIRAAAAGELLPRISDDADFFICALCPYRIRCHALAPGGNA